MKLADFELLKDIIHQQSGLLLTTDQSYLLDSRLTPVAKKWNFPSISVMAVHLRSIPEHGLVKDIVEAMMSHETSFFREPGAFKTLEDTVLPHFQKTRPSRKPIRLWSAGCSTGQEAYSLAIAVKEWSLRTPGWKFEIVATDLSDTALNTARKGEYSQFEVQNGLPVSHLMKYFEQKSDHWLVSEDIRNMVKFSSLNLLHHSARLGLFDVIFCRNVLISFDDPTRTHVFDNLVDNLDKDSFLILGEEETTVGLTDKFRPVPGKENLYVHQTETQGPESQSASSRLKSLFRF